MLSPDTTDVVTRLEARAALSLGSNDVELEKALESLTTTVSRLFDDVFGCQVVRTVTETHDCPQRGKPLVLHERPVNSVTSVTVDGTALDAADYLVRAAGDQSQLHRLSGGRYTTWRAYNAEGITVVYEAGRFADTDSVDRQVKDAALMQLRDWWPATQYGTRDVDGFELAATRARGGISESVRRMLPAIRTQAFV